MNFHGKWVQSEKNMKSAAFWAVTACSSEEPNIMEEYVTSVFKTEEQAKQKSSISRQ